MDMLWNVWGYLTSVDGAKFLSGIAACVTILSGGYALLKAYRYGQSQIGYRLAEYLASEEERLAHARQALGELAQRPNPSSPVESTTFSKLLLERTLRRMGWGMRDAEGKIAAAAARCEQQVTLSMRQASIHQKEQVLSHLLLGAIADSRANHADAFAEFEKALQIDDKDVQAIEYAGFQLLKLGNAIGAKEYFEKLATIAETRGDQYVAARAYQLQAFAYEQLGGLVQANSLLVKATSTFPVNAVPLDVAFAHEQHGRVRRKAGYNNANQSLEKALVFFSRLNTTEGRNGVERITQTIKELNLQSTLGSNEYRAAEGFPSSGPH